MNKCKKLLLFVLLFALFLCIPKADAATTRLLVNGSYISYKSGENVMINTEYVNKGTEFRAVWISPLTSDISGYTNEQQYKKQMIEVLDKMEVYNLNVMLFHVRLMNDAVYESKYNAWSSYYNTDPDWDALPWLIEECHKRGIEFHAWMNPYRVTTNVAKTVEEIAAEAKPANAASNPNNLLKGDTCTILDPGRPTVRTFLVNTCMELVENYDVDAIHFDDYFYTKGIDDSKTRAEFNTNGLSVSEFRRDAVNQFMKSLDAALTKFNKENGRAVQLGISPTGVYRNGNGNVTYDSNNNPVTNGSATGGYAHYDSPLYADSLYWIENEWIDYILPQTYHAITNYAAPYCDLVGWWDKVMKYSNVNLYCSIGLYMSGDTSSSSWYSNDLEAYHQAYFCNTLENVRGTSIYGYKAYEGGLSSSSKLYELKDDWDTPIILPEIRTVTPLNVDQVSNFKLTKTNTGTKLSFDKMDEAKFYVLYRSTKPLTYSGEEVLDVIGDVSIDGVVNYIDNTSTEGVTYYYGIKAQSYSLKLGEGVSLSTENIETGSELDLGPVINYGITDNLISGETVTIFWDEKYYPFGESINYTVEYSFDNGETVTSTNVYKSRNRYNFDLKIPEDVLQLNVNIVCENNLGASKTPISKNITDALPVVNNFGYIGTPYLNEKLTFVWNNLNIDGVKYVIQYSSDNYFWDDLKEVNEYKNGLNIRTDVLLTNAKGYYRVYASKDNMVSYSNAIEFTAQYYLGDYKNLQVNGKDLEYSYTFSEGETFKITWDKNSSSAIYSLMISDNGDNWFAIRNYVSKFSLTENGNEMVAEITLSEAYYGFYIKISGIDGSNRNESPLIKINVMKDMIFYDELSNYFKTERNAFVNALDLFK